MKHKVAVLFGGKSTEHEISIISALQAIPNIDPERFDVIPVYISKDNDFYIGDGIGNIEEYRDIPALLGRSTRVLWVKDGSVVKLIRYPLKKIGDNTVCSVDIAFPIVHGTNEEDGTLTGFLETLGLPVVGCDVLSSAVGMNKYVSKAVFRDNGIPVLPCLTRDLRDYEDPEQVINDIEAAFSYPVIVKPMNLGSSIGISKATDRESLHGALALAFTFTRKILVEPAIINLKEINCSVLGDHEEAIASECEEPVGSDDILSFEDKYINGSGSKSNKTGLSGEKLSGGSKTGGSKSGMASLKRKIPADITDAQRDKIRTMAVKAFSCLGCSGVARIDFMMDEVSGDIYLNEINTIPGSLSFYLWEPIGISYRELLSRLIDLAIQRDREEHKLVTSFDTNVLAGVKL